MTSGNCSMCSHWTMSTKAIQFHDKYGIPDIVQWGHWHGAQKVHLTARSSSSLPHWWVPMASASWIFSVFCVFFLFSAMNVLNNLHLAKPPPRRKAECVHKEPLTAEYDDIFRKKYHFRKETVRNLADYLSDELAPTVKSNNTYTISKTTYHRNFIFLVHNDFGHVSNSAKFQVCNFNTFQVM